MSIIRRALLIVPASLAAFALSGTAAQADTGTVVFGDENTVTNTHTTNNLTWIDDSFNQISTVDVDVDWVEHTHAHAPGHDGHDGGHDHD